jgi:hypothetical protein
MTDDEEIIQTALDFWKHSRPGQRRTPTSRYSNVFVVGPLVHAILRDSEGTVAVFDARNHRFIFVSC